MPSKTRTPRWIRTIPGNVDKQDITELARQLQEMIYDLEGRRGPITSKDGVNIDAEGRHTALKFKGGTGEKGVGSLSFGGLQNSSMFLAKGAHQDDDGNWVADDNTAVIQEMQRDSVTPLMYRNTGLVVGRRFQPTPVGYAAVTTSPSGPGGFTPPSGGGGGSGPSTPVDEIGPRHPMPHTHGVQDVVGLPGSLAFGVLGNRLPPHTHNYMDLVGSQLLLPIGSATLPSVSFRSSQSTGIYFSPTSFRIAVAGNFAAQFATGQLWLPNDISNVVWGASADVYLQRDAANTLGQRNSTNPQTFRIYNTFTDAGNYERLTLQFGYGARLSYEAAGTGAAKDMYVENLKSGGNLYFATDNTARWRVVTTTGHFYPNVDATYDIGTSTFRPRTGYFGGAAASKGLVVIGNVAQSVNLQEWQDSGLNPLAAIDKDGAIAAANWMIQMQVFGN